MNLRALIAIAAVGAPAAAAAQPPLEAYGKLPSLEQVTLSPSGERFALVGVIGEKRTLVAATVDGEALLRAPVGDAKLQGVGWAGDGRLLLGYSQTVKLPVDYVQSIAELSSITAIDLERRSAAPIFDKARSLSPIVFGDAGVRRIDGRWYGHLQAVRKDELGYKSPDLYRIDLEKGSADRLALGTEKADDWALDANGEVLARTRLDRESGKWRLIEGRHGGREIASRNDPQGRVSLVGLGRTPRTVLIVDSTGDRDMALEQPLDPGSAPQELFRDDHVERFLYDPDTHLLLGALIGDGGRAVLFDPARQKKFDAAIKAFPGLQVTLVDHTASLDRMIVFTDGKDDSGTYWLVEIAKRSARPIGRAYPEVKPADVGPTRMFAYAAADGLEMEGVLTLPPGREAKGLPVVVMPHGGPIGVHDEVGFDWEAQAYASRGYAVFQPNFRGSGGYTRKFRDAGMGEWGRKMQTDVSDGLAALAKAGVVDPKRACIVGSSYGGYAALAGVTLQQGLYRCAVSVSGVSDLPVMLNYWRQSTGTTNIHTRFLKAAIGERADMKAYSPVEKAEAADAPVLLIHGKDDTVVPVDQSRRMHRALRRAEKPVELIELKGEDHGMSREETRLAMLKASVAFVEKHNPAD